MSRVRVLKEELVSLISAGEVIENPASIVKELIENAFDAGASQIEVEIREGGIDTIVVSDNGSGILRDDCPICILRYSTSKVSTREDIEAISTYGFRGEALASIAAVANLKIDTRHKDEELGTQLVSRVGEEPIIIDSARPHGTRIEVTDLFKRMPARLKHLDSATRESQIVHEIVMKHASIRHDVGFRFIRDGSIIVDCPPLQSSRERVLSLWGTELAKALIDIQYSEAGIIIHGFIVRPPASRGNRGREYFSICSRPIEDRRLSQAVEEAYSTLLMKGRFPICAIDIEVDLTRVDANVHPTKREVRVQEIDSIIVLVKRVVRDALTGYQDHAETGLLGDYVEEDLTTTTEREKTESSLTTQARLDLVEEASLLDIIPGSVAVDTDALSGVFRVIGQTQNLYLLLDVDDGLVIVDQHAAHERIVYERLRKEVNSGRLIVQELLEPIVLKLDSTSREKILELTDILETLGYSISEFGGNEIIVSSTPEVLGQRASEDELIALVDRILDIGSTAKEQFMDDIVRLTACHSSIRAGQSLSNREIRDLIVELAKTPNMYNCCHGRPSIVKLTRKELDKRFGRDGPEAITRYKARHRM
ncbi:MAG: DNA mismatch repair endonuclease MutL [Candidatus Thorarchaeota archaeon]